MLSGTITYVCSIICFQFLIDCPVYLLNIDKISSIFPACLKTDTTKPLYNGGDRGDISNYRMIYIISPISKIVETIIGDGILNYFESVRLFSPNHCFI